MVRQKALIQSSIEPVSVRPAVKPTVQVSKKNRLLAQAMASKPSVLAALKIKRKSIKQRLGGKFIAFFRVVIGYLVRWY